jgi:hypothetical protein
MKLYLNLVFLLLFTGCELIVIGTKREQKPVVNLTQDTPLGAVYLFKAELDSNNISSASDILARNNGQKFLAIERYEMFFDIDRLKRMIYMKPVTKVKTDTIDSKSFRFLIEYDYLKNVSFTALKINEEWYVTKWNVNSNKSY